MAIEYVEPCSLCDGTGVIELMATEFYYQHMYDFTRQVWVPNRLEKHVTVQAPCLRCAKERSKRSEQHDQGPFDSDA